MKTDTSNTSHRHRTASRTRRSRRERRHPLQELVASATRALAILRARAAQQHADAQHFGAATSR